jgi:hypothetical protein
MALLMLRRLRPNGFAGRSFLRCFKVLPGFYTGHVPKQTLAWHVWLVLHGLQVREQTAEAKPPCTVSSSLVVRFLMVSWFSVSRFSFFSILNGLLTCLKRFAKPQVAADYMLVHGFTCN